MASLPEIPYLDFCAENDEPAQPKLVGIAKLAAEGDSIRQGHNVEYFSLLARSILNRCTAERMPFTWTVNPYRGCEFACKYCYARYTHEFMEIRDSVEFERQIFIKEAPAHGLHVVAETTPGSGLRALLRKDLKKVKPGEEIAIGTATDPYQPAERKYQVTRSLLEEFAEHRGLDIGIVTKSDLIVRDIDVLKRVASQNRLFVNMTVTTLDSDLARILEPRAPRPDLRLKALQALNVSGIDAGVICAPVLPGITDSNQQLEAIVAATARQGGKYIFANPLFLKTCSASVFMPFLKENFPHLASDYEKRFSSRAFVSTAYRKRISDMMARLRNKYGITPRYALRAQEPPESQEEQLALFRPDPPKRGFESHRGFVRRRRSMC